MLGFRRILQSWGWGTGGSRQGGRGPRRLPEVEPGREVKREANRGSGPECWELALDRLLGSDQRLGGRGGGE